MAHATLHRDVQYGKIPFDNYVLDKWDFSMPITEDQEQWNHIAREWLATTSAYRREYHEMNRTRTNEIPQEHIQRVLVPNQTIQERRQAAYMGGREGPVWLRTCYNPELAGVYNSLEPLDPSTTIYQNILNDEELYDFGSDWTRIFLRLPSLASAWNDVSDEELDNVEPEYEHERPVHNVRRHKNGTIYLLDEEALREELIKVIWFDVHGRDIWDIKIPVEAMDELEMALAGDRDLVGVIGQCAMTVDNVAAWQRGALVMVDHDSNGK